MRQQIEEILCDNCNSKTPGGGWIFLCLPTEDYDLCSLSCLTELAWRLRDSQPKLSKSRQVETSWEDPNV
jgi:hypothetical protein